MADFLLELLSEEIPARMQARARNELARLFVEGVQAAGLETGPIDTHSTPRRLVLIARDVAGATQASREEVKGPRASAPPQALEGFLRKTGLSREQLEERDGVLFAVIERPGRPAADVLADAVKRIIAEFAWAKSMRWGSGPLRWVRPLHGIVAMIGEEIVPIAVDGIQSGATTVGHRFHHPGPITIGGAHDYAEKLRACQVIVDQRERERLIREGAQAAAAEAGLTLLDDEGLVVENAGLTEWPVPLFGRFDPDFLDVPREVIVLTMRTNQKYFACVDENADLAPAFVCVANVTSSDGGAAIIGGNRRVLAARLSDARFFWEQDLKVPLEEQARKLDQIVFHEKLGTVADKVERVAKLARWLVKSGVVEARAEEVERAARLTKADLVTGMVGEFPELQGVIGGYIAAAQGEPQAVADAVRDHYKPIGQDDAVPKGPVSVAVALADKLDTLIAFFTFGIRPTGSKDPFALRRAGLAIATIILENRLRLPLYPALQEHIQSVAFGPLTTPLHAQIARDFEAFERSGIDAGALNALTYLQKIKEADRTSTKIAEAVENAFETIAFLADRLKVQQRDAGVRHDLIDAVFSLGGEDDLVRLLARVNALQSFVETAEGADLLTAYKRAANILKKENWTGTGASAESDLAPQEAVLITALDTAGSNASAAVEAEDFTGAMAALASLRRPIDDFFDHVTVNDPDAAKRERRLNLLMRFRDAVNRVADFSKIEG
jgi:glycyl-tRNA synthetase beta chain